MMFSLSGYQILTQLYESANSEVYRAIRKSDNFPVILKILKQDYPTPVELTRYQQEYKLTRMLTLESIVKVYGLEKYQNTLILFIEDFGGESLKFSLKSCAFSLAEFLSIAIKTVTSLGQIHAANIIHKDINPANIVFNRETGQLKIIDFGISTQLPRELPTLKAPNVLEGTLAYLSPEQTGRMNRSLDYRTDFYSLGVTFYELLTNQLPFAMEDDLELIHCHIAQPPVPPLEINPAIPSVISAIIMKLMEKNAEDRYQSAFGLKYDLEQILANLTDPTNLSNFQLAQQDISSKFLIPQKLYGRENTVAPLFTAFERVAQGQSELLLVAGYSGIGKTAVVQEIYKPITEKRGHFIAGKFDQFQRNVPYSAVVQAFRDLVQQLLTEPQSRLNEWKIHILTAVGNSGQVITEVISEVELIIGAQPPVLTLPPTESQNRFNLVFQNFIKVFCQANHPLVIFLDDLQWIDSASLKLLTLMMSDVPYLLLIGAYRDNEVSPVHPLLTTAAEMQKQGLLVQTLTLSPLTLDHLNQLVSDTLHLPLTDTAPLTELVLEKTGGNPFFVSEFLKTLYTEQLLEFNLQQQRWQWNLVHIRAHNITDNVVELMAGKIRQLPKTTQDILVLAAAVGNQFDLATLAIISQQSYESVKTNLWEALTEGLVVPLSENYKFVHDRVQQAAYSLIPEGEKPALHWQIGQLLKNNLGENLAERLFEVVDHLNQGSSLATTAEKMPLIRLNLQAGQQAKLTTAYRTAAEYLRHGLKWLTPVHWQIAYELTLSIHLELVEISYLCGDFDQMEAVAEIILQQAHTHLDKVKVYEVRVQAYIGQALLFKALQTAREGLSLFGVEFPEKPTPAEVDLALAETATKWRVLPISEWVHLPRMTAPNRLAAVRLLSIIMPASYQGMPELFPLVVSKMINLSIDHGNSELSPFLYACYGMFLCGAMEIEAGYQFGQLAIQVLEQLNVQVHRARALEIVNGFINPWKERLSLPTQRLKEIYQLGIEEGDVEFGGYAALIHCECAYFCGLPLAELESTQASYLPILTRLKQNTSVNYLKIYLQTTLSLYSVAPPPSNSAIDHTEDSEMPFLVSEQDKEAYGFHFYTNRSCLHYLFYKPHQALEHALLAKRYPAASSGNFVVAFSHFYESLSYLAVYPDFPLAKQEEILQQVSANQEKMKQWAHHAPMNCQHKYDLVEAEKARVLGGFELAAKSYEKAIAGARENEYLQEEALAYELAARFYLSRGMEKFAQIYLQEALYRYQRWGAVTKVKQLAQKYPQLLTRSSITSRFKGKVVATRLSTGRDSNLDLTTVMKASQAISGEIVLDKLLTALMKILIQNAGAQVGYLILVNQGQLLITASGTLNAQQTTGLQAIPVETCQMLSETIVNYVARTKTTVVLENATKHGQFTNDAYIKQHQPKSVLCTPLINQGKLVSIIYLENNLTTGAFTVERVEILKILSAQAAISIKNAQLYDHLAALNRAYQRFVPQEFLHCLEKSSIIDVELGDQVQLEMSVLFSDIRDFTTLSEKMTPKDNFQFINAYLSRMESAILENNGFIDKYIGDAVMALFSGSADDAVNAGLAMLQQLDIYNQERTNAGEIPIKIGIGINTGNLMLGTVGGRNRMDTTVISDAVNLASRVESLTKNYGVSLLITQHTYVRLRNPTHYVIRPIDTVKVKGKSELVAVYAVSK